MSAEGWGGYSVARRQCGDLTNVTELPTAPVQMVCFPNPFNPKTSIRLDLPKQGSYRIDAFDTAGRRVVTLAARNFAAGGHIVEWNGCDDAGRQLGSGMYLIRVQGANYEATTKALLVK